MAVARKNHDEFHGPDSCGGFQSVLMMQPAQHRGLEFDCGAVRHIAVLRRSPTACTAYRRIPVPMASGAQDSRMEASRANRVPLASDKRSAHAARAVDLLEPEDDAWATPLLHAHEIGQAPSVADQESISLIKPGGDLRHF